MKWLNILFYILVSGCASNPIRQDIRIIPIDNTPIVKVHKHCVHQWDYDTGKCWTCNASFSPMKTKIKTARLKDNKQVMIHAIMIETGLSEPEATILWEKYKRSNIKGMAPYLIEINPYQKIDRIYIDLMERIKVRTKILKRNK